MEKKLILVTSPPACGKTYVAKALAKNLKHVVYLDKDTLIVLSKQIFKVAGQPYDRSSAFFQQNIRDYEYDCVLALAMEALDYDDIVLINAPFTQEVRDCSPPGHIREAGPSWPPRARRWPSSGSKPRPRSSISE